MRQLEWGLIAVLAAGVFVQEQRVITAQKALEAIPACTPVVFQLTGQDYKIVSTEWHGYPRKKLEAIK